MTAQTHTPGPWEVVPPGKWHIGSGWGVQAKTPEGPGWPTPSATGYYAMCCPPPHGKDKQGEQEANARLIAAAPDLLAQAKCFEMLLEFEIARCLREGDTEMAQLKTQSLSLVRAAIAKTEPRP